MIKPIKLPYSNCISVQQVQIQFTMVHAGRMGARRTKKERDEEETQTQGERQEEWKMSRDQERGMIRRTMFTN